MKRSRILAGTVAAMFAAVGLVGATAGSASASYNYYSLSDYEGLWKLNEAAGTAVTADDYMVNNTATVDTSGCGSSCSTSGGAATNPLNNPDTLDANGVTYQGGSGGAYFNGHARLLAPMTPELSPGSNTWQYGFDIKLKYLGTGSGNDEYQLSGELSGPSTGWGWDTKANVAQAGLTGDTSLAKAEINYTTIGAGGTTLVSSVATCTFAGTTSGGNSVIKGKTSLVDNPAVHADTAWHHIDCRKTAGTISVWVDGVLDASKTVSIGTTSFTSPYWTLGAKKASNLAIDTHDSLNGYVKNFYIDTDTAPAASISVDAPSGELFNDYDHSGTVSLGDQIRVSTSVWNTGKQRILSATASGAIGSEASPTWTCAPGAFFPGDGVSCDAYHVISSADVAAGSITVTPTGGATKGTGGAVTPVAGPSAVVITIPPSGTSSLSIAKTATVTDLNADGVTSVGDKIVSTYAVNNTGSRTETSVYVTDTQSGLGSITCGATTLAGGAGTTCTAAPYYITSGDVASGTVSGTATAHGTDTLSAAITSSGSPTTTTIGAPSVLTLTKSASVADTNTSGVTGDAGDVITYAYVVDNTATTNGMHALVMTDTYATGSPVTVSCALATLAKTPVSGHSQTCTETYTITSGDVAAGSVVSTGNANAKFNTSNVLVIANAATTTTLTH